MPVTAVNFIVINTATKNIVTSATFQCVIAFLAIQKVIDNTVLELTRVEFH